MRDNVSHLEKNQNVKQLRPARAMRCMCTAVILDDENLFRIN